MYYRCTNPAYELFDRATRDDTGILRRRCRLRAAADFAAARRRLRGSPVQEHGKSLRSNPPPRLGKPMYYRCTNPALHGSCVEFLDIIASFLQKSNRFLAKRKNRASGGRPGGIQQSLAPAGMASSSMTRWSFSSPFSLCTAESNMPHDSWPIIFLGGRLTMAASVLPTRASGS